MIDKKDVNTSLFLSILKDVSPDTLAKVVSEKKKTNKTDEEKSTVKSVSETASKVMPLEKSDEMYEMLSKIYGFLKKSNENKIKLSEKENNFKEENEFERAKRHQQLIDAIKKIEMGGTATKVEEENNMSFFDIVGGILGAFGGGKTALSLLTSIGRFFLFNPFGAALLLGTATVGMLFNDKNPEQTNKMLEGALNPAAEVQAVNEAITNTDAVQKRKDNLLADRPRSKKSYNVFNPTKDIELQQKYLEEIGFDENTGLTKAERDAGFTGLDEKGRPTKETATRIETTPAEQPATTIPTNQSPTGAPAGTPPVSNEVSPEIKTSTIPPEKSLSPGESLVVSESLPSEAEKLNTVIKENLSAKLEESLSPGETVVVNNTSSSTGSVSRSAGKSSLPSVRNLESTYQKMIYDSTRLV